MDDFDISAKIQQLETHLQILYGDMASYLKSIEKTKVKSSRMSQHMKDYSNIETPGMKASFAGFSDCLSQIEDRRKELYDRLQIKVYEAMKTYETNCKDMKAWLKRCTDAEQTQSKKQKELAILNAKSKGQELSKVTFARTALSKAAADTKSVKDQFYKELENFEKQKIRDFRAMWTEYIHSHIMYHSKALELFTRAHLVINSVDENEELETVLRYTRAHQTQDDQQLDDGLSGSRPGTPASPNPRGTGRNPMNSSTTSLPPSPSHSLSHSALHSPPHHSHSTSSLPMHSPPTHSAHSPSPLRNRSLSASIDSPPARGLSSSQLNHSGASVRRANTNSNLRSSRASVPAVDDDDDFDN